MQSSECSASSPLQPPRTKERSVLLSIASLLAITWAAVLLLSSIALLIPLARLNTYRVPVLLVALLAIPGLMLLAGGIGSRLGSKVAIGATILISIALTLLSIIQLSKGIPIAFVGVILNPCVAALLIAHLLRASKPKTQEGA